MVAIEQLRCSYVGTGYFCRSALYCPCANIEDSNRITSYFIRQFSRAELPKLEIIQDFVGVLPRNYCTTTEKAYFRSNCDVFLTLLVVLNASFIL